METTFTKEQQIALVMKQADNLRTSLASFNLSPTMRNVEVLRAIQDLRIAASIFGQFAEELTEMIFDEAGVVMKSVQQPTPTGFKTDPKAGRK